jgi:hypothetical protein
MTQQISNHVKSFRVQGSCQAQSERLPRALQFLHEGRVHFEALQVEAAVA